MLHVHVWCMGRVKWWPHNCYKLSVIQTKAINILVPVVLEKLTFLVCPDTYRLQ